jgi:hypothetical protein
VKLIFDSLDALVQELRDQKVDVVRVSPAVQAELDARGVGVPRLTCRIVVTAALADQGWAEWRYWVGRAPAEVGERGLQLPDWLARKRDEALRAVSQRLDDEGLAIREGLLAHDTALVDCFRL